MLNAVSYPDNGTRNPLLLPFAVSIMGHLLLFGFLLYHPGQKTGDAFFPAVIDVQMVEMPAGAPVAEQAAKKKDADASLPEPSRAESTAETAAGATSADEAEVSVASTPKMKTALKYKTFKSKEVLKNTLQRLERKVDTTPPKPLEDTIKRLREQVAKEGRPESADSVTEGTAEGKAEGYAVGSKQEGEAIDIYRLDVAYTINKNWAFAEQLASGASLVASVVFKIMPNGKIEDIFFTDRSGNAYLDDSALKAIVKSSPVKPHPPGLNRPFIELGLRFTPKGVQ